MYKKIALPFILIAALALSGCSELMRPAEQKPTATAGEGRARVVFMRTSMVAGAIGVELFEIVNGEMKFIGQLPMGNKVIYETTPGEKVFMAYGNAADFMRANLVAGKTYYSIVRPNWGTGGFAPTPIRADGSSDYNMKSKEFSDWVSGTTLIEPNEKAQPWFEENKVRYLGIHKEYWARWLTKTDSEKAQRTLRPEDGI